jgi:hypothetical protein
MTFGRAQEICQSRGRKTDRVAYVLSEWDLPEPKAGAEWAADNTFKRPKRCCVIQP